MKVKSQSEVAQLYPTLATTWTAAYQAPPSMGFSRQEYWSGVPLPSPTIILVIILKCYDQVSLSIAIESDFKHVFYGFTLMLSEEYC